MRTALRYWIRVFKHAYSQTITKDAYWRSHLGWGAVAAFGIGAALFWYWEGWDKTVEQWNVWIAFSAAAGIFLLIGALLLNIFRAPSDLEHRIKKQYLAKIRRLEDRITHLENSQQQLLEFDFRPEDNKFLQSVFIGRNLAPDVVGRVAVKNTSKSLPVSDVETTLIHYWRDGACRYVTTEIPLSSYSTGETRDSIPPRRSITYDLFRISGADNKMIALGPRPDGTFERIPTGRYRVKITASSTSTPSLSRFFLLELHPSGEIEYRPWRPGDSKH